MINENGTRGLESWNEKQKKENWMRWYVMMMKRGRKASLSGQANEEWRNKNWNRFDHRPTLDFSSSLHLPASSSARITKFGPWTLKIGPKYFYVYNCLTRKDSNWSTPQTQIQPRPRKEWEISLRETENGRFNSTTTIHCVVVPYNVVQIHSLSQRSTSLRHHRRRVSRHVNTRGGKRDVMKKQWISVNNRNGSQVISI